ncbi:hypothetical protein [Xanthomonas phage DES1]|nr:hypothetical protein [Xanthomonas phage DES1]
MVNYSAMYDRWLDQAYAYYVTFDNHMSDAEWDSIGRTLSDNWDKWDHSYKHLVSKDNMFTAYYINADSYPDKVKQAHE